MSRSSTLVAYRALTPKEVDARLRAWAAKQRPRFDENEIKRILESHDRAVRIAVTSEHLAHDIEALQLAQLFIRQVFDTRISAVHQTLGDILESRYEEYEAAFFVVGWRLHRPRTDPFPTALMVCLGRALSPQTLDDSERVLLSMRRIVDVLVALGDGGSRRDLQKVVRSLLAPRSRTLLRRKKAERPNGLRAHQQLIVQCVARHLRTMLEALPDSLLPRREVSHLARRGRGGNR